MAKLKDAQSVLGPWQEWGPPPHGHSTAGSAQHRRQGMLQPVLHELELHGERG